FPPIPRLDAPPLSGSAWPRVGARLRTDAACADMNQSLFPPKLWTGEDWLAGRRGAKESCEQIPRLELVHMQSALYIPADDVVAAEFGLTKVSETRRYGSLWVSCLCSNLG